MFALIRLRALPSLALLLAAALGASGCLGTRVVREPVASRGSIEAYLRHYEKGGEPVERGFDHPAVIASVRLAHILSFVDVEVPEKKGTRRVPAIDPVILYEVADVLEAGLEQAKPWQEVVVRAVRKERRLGIFHTEYLTTFLAYVKGDLLTLHFGHAAWEVPKLGADRGGEDLPEPREDRQLMDFRVVPDPALTLLAPQTVAVDWRSERFADPTRIQLTPTGEVQRRTILLDSPPPAEAPRRPASETPIESLEPETLRALADLEERRRRGEVTEAEYQVLRREILAADPGVGAP